MDNEKNDGKWRTLLRVQAVDTYHIYFVIPAWDPIVPIGVQINTIPDKIVQACYSGQDYFHAMANLAAETEDYLDLSDWEIGG